MNTTASGERVGVWQIGAPRLRLALTLICGLIGAVTFSLAGWERAMFGLSPWTSHPWLFHAGWLALLAMAIAMIYRAERSVGAAISAFPSRLGVRFLAASVAPVILFLSRPLPGDPAFRKNDYFWRRAFAIFPYVLPLGMVIVCAMDLFFLGFFTYLSAAIIVFFGPIPQASGQLAVVDAPASRRIGAIGTAALMLEIVIPAAVFMIGVIIYRLGVLAGPEEYVESFAAKAIALAAIGGMCFLPYVICVTCLSRPRFRWLTIAFPTWAIATVTLVSVCVSAAGRGTPPLP